MSELISDKTLGLGEAPAKIEFPCPYPVKILGSATVNFEVVVLNVVEQHVENFDRSTVSSRDSKKGSFRSVSLTITATGEQQLDALHKALMAIDQVKMVL